MTLLPPTAPPKKILLIVIIGLLILGSLVFAPGPNRQGTTIVVEPNHFLNQAGQTWTARVMVDTNQPVNSVDVTLTYNPQLVEVRQMDIADSDFGLKVFEPAHDRDKATLRFVQTSLQSYDDQRALVGAITFKGLKQGQLDLATSQAQIIANDGQGTDLYQPRLTQSLGQWLLGLLGLDI